MDYVSIPSASYDASDDALVIMDGGETIATLYFEDLNGFCPYENSYGFFFTDGSQRWFEFDDEVYAEFFCEEVMRARRARENLHGSG